MARRKQQQLRRFLRVQTLPLDALKVSKMHSVQNL